MGEMADAIRESTAVIVALRAENACLQERGVDLWHRVEEREAGWQYALECRQARILQLKEGWQFQVDRAVKAEALAERRKEALADCLQEFERICSYAAKLHVQAEEAGAGGLGVHDAWFASHAEQGKLKARAAIEEEGK